MKLIIKLYLEMSYIESDHIVFDKSHISNAYAIVLQMVVMDEVHKQMSEIAAKQKDRLDEMGAEIRKLKAMIVKHESRIRTLETKNRDLESQVTRGSGGAGGPYNNGDHDDDMDPDEV